MIICKQNSKHRIILLPSCHISGGKAACASFIEKCYAFIGENAVDTVKTTAFCNLPKEALVKLISSDYLGLEEEDVWRAVLNWAKYQVCTDRAYLIIETSPLAKRQNRWKSIVVLGSALVEMSAKENWNTVRVASSVLARKFLQLRALRDNFMSSFVTDLTMIFCLHFVTHCTCIRPRVTCTRRYFVCRV